MTLSPEIIDVAHSLADAARRAILPHFRNLSAREDNKASSGYDPVTLADKAAEQAMRDILGKERPEDAILGEEFGNKEGTSGLTWVLDPIDGTRGFVAGSPTWGVLIAVSDDTGPIFGIVDQPYIGERFVGTGTAAFLHGPLGQSRLRTRDTDQLTAAILCSTFPEIGTPDERVRFEAVARDVKLVRYGMDCYAYALLAAGQIDLVIEAGLQPYDIQAPIALIEAAGGIVTDWTGGPAHAGGRVLAAANKTLHAVALERLSQA